MTVRDLVECAWCLEGIEIVVRENGGGRWIQGFRVSPHAKIYSYEACAEHREDRNQFGFGLVHLKEGEVVDVMTSSNLPMKVFCVDPKKAPKDVLDLVVNHYQPRNIPSIHGDIMTHNDFCMEINCFPPEQTEKLAVYREIIDDQIEGQMSIEEFLGGD